MNKHDIKKFLILLFYFCNSEWRLRYGSSKLFWLVSKNSY